MRNHSTSLSRRPNTGKPGYLFIGADNDGKPSGLHYNDDLQKDLAGIRSEGNTLLPAMVDEKEIKKDMRHIEVQLASLGLFYIPYNCPTNAGILLIGKNPTRFIPSASIQYVQFEGLTKGSKVLNEHLFKGNLLTELKILDNTGNLYGKARPENFPMETDYRNPLISGVMRALGFVNRFGMGIGLVADELKENGNPPAEYILSEPSSFKVIVRSADPLSEQINRGQAHRDRLG